MTQGGDVARAAKGVAFGAPDRGKAANREATGRLCKASGCETVLSTYNHAITCYTHTAPDTRHATHR